MTSKKSMEKALRAEGWKKHPGLPGFWIDPVESAREAIRSKGKFDRVSVHLENGHHIAMRRKAARERAALKKAGWKWHDCGPYAVLTAGWKTNRKDFPGPYTRAEALASLTQEGGAK